MKMLRQLVTAALVSGALLAAPVSAGAATTMSDGGTYNLTADTYTYATSGLESGSGLTDNFYFNVTSTAYNALGSVVTISLFGGTGFSSFLLEWVDPVLGVTGSASVASPGPQVDVNLPLASTGLYLLRLTYSTIGVGGSYLLQVNATPVSPIPGVPLPPAVILFISALAGMGFLARRRRATSDSRLALTSGAAA